MKISDLESRYLASIADVVNTFLSSPEKKITDNHALFRVIEQCLIHVVPDMRFHPYLVHGSNSNPFIMGIYPSTKELDTKSSKLLSAMNEGNTEQFMKEWTGIRDWYVEIDPRILTKGNRLCVDDGDQFVAILCHEVGHVLNRNPMQLLQNYMEHKRTMGRAEAMLMSKNTIIRKFALPMFVHTLQFKIFVKNIANSNKLNDELMADNYIPEQYRGAMVSYVENHILLDPSSSDILTTNEDFDRQQKVAISFSRECINMMRKRRSVLKNSIKAQYDQNNSKYMSNLVSDIGKAAMGYDPETDETNAVQERVMLRCLESDIADCIETATKLLEAATVTSRDIAILQVQADDIQTVDQKLFIVHTIYDMSILHI